MSWLSDEKRDLLGMTLPIFIVWPPRNLIKKIPLHGGGLWWSFRIDETSIIRIPVAFVVSWLFCWQYIALIELGQQLEAAISNENCSKILHCKHGTDIADILGTLTGIGLWLLISNVVI